MNEKTLWDNDRRQLQQVAGGDMKAFERVYQKTARNTFFYLVRMLGERDLAEDVTAEAYTQVWKSAKSFRGESSAGTWIIGIARNLAKKALMKTGRTRSLEERPEPVAENPKTIERLSRAKALSKAIGMLSPDHREVLDLVFFCQMTYPEVSRTVGIPVNTVKTRVFYAKEKLKKTLDGMGITENDI
jgi:RNA polymerase sigma-70 factor (ECF subfamily)